jgi:hypothetical protein
MRHLLIGYTTKDGGKEFTSVKGYDLPLDTPVPSHAKIRKDCIDWANSNGEDFKYFQINFMQFVNESDYQSFMEVKQEQK